MATIKDVAKLAGVSATTVSIVINGKGKERLISEETSRRIYKAMEALNYHPNQNARRLRSSDSGNPAIAIFWPGNYLIYVMTIVINDLLKYTEELGFPCELVIQSYDPAHCERIPEVIAKNCYDAAIIGCASEPVIEYLDTLRATCPLIFMNRISRCHSYVVADMQKPLCEAARALSRKGVREVGMFTVSSGNYAAERRVRFFADACAEVGIEIPEQFVVRAESTTRDGFQAMQRFLALPGHPRTIFCNSDIIALGALTACHEQNIRVPEELEIMGIELMDPQFSEYSIPPLTTVAMPTDELCRTIVEHLIERIAHHNQDRLQYHCSAQLIVRESLHL